MQNPEGPTDPFSMPMIFLRVGWMDRYRGLTGGDAISGGGKFVEQHGFGHEIFNFKEYSGQVYGYVQPPRGSADEYAQARINIGRLGASSQDRSVSDVLAVWVASRPSVHQCVIVGWYQNATVYRDFQPSPPGVDRTHDGEEFGYYITAASTDATLLTADQRLLVIPTGGKGQMGQSNVWYADAPEIHDDFRCRVLNFIEKRELPDPTPTGDHGTPHQPDPLLRQKVEKAAVDATTKHFTKIGYAVDSFEKDNVGWDLEAVHGPIKLRLEVKGLSGAELCMELTPNEYAKMQEYRDSYRICVVTQALSDPRLAVFAFSRDSQRWEDQDGRPLSFEEIIAAQCRAD